jgi:hypothetical protein
VIRLVLQKKEVPIPGFFLKQRLSSTGSCGCYQLVLARNSDVLCQCLADLPGNSTYIGIGCVKTLMFNERTVLKIFFGHKH